MEESDQPTKPEEKAPTPEVAQLLKLLDLQATALRDRRIARPGALRGDSFRWGSLIAIVIFAFGSIAIMEWMLSQLPKPAHLTAPTPPAISAPDGKSGSPSPNSGEK